jgi:hypothetical protein
MYITLTKATTRTGYLTRVAYSCLSLLLYLDSTHNNGASRVYHVSAIIECMRSVCTHVRLPRQHRQTNRLTRDMYPLGVECLIFVWPVKAPDAHAEILSVLNPWSINFKILLTFIIYIHHENNQCICIPASE